jgi:hypothetical protein
METKAYTQKTNKSSLENNKNSLSSITSTIVWREKINIHTLKFRTTNILILINNNTNNYLIIVYINTNQRVNTDTKKKTATK